MDTTGESTGTTTPVGDAVRPTYAPIAASLAISMTFWGLIALTLNIRALLLMSLAGICLFAWALKRWIGEIVLHWETRR
jgi:hypothetical protein